MGRASPTEHLIMKHSVPSELSEQAVVVRALRAAQILFCAVPNGGKRDRIEAGRLVMSGVESGVPDLLIFDPPPCGLLRGAAIEMKRQGARPSDTRPDQRKWHAALKDRGWEVAVCAGAAEALQFLRDLGYKL